MLDAFVQVALRLRQALHQAAAGDHCYFHRWFKTLVGLFPTQTSHFAPLIF